VFGVGVAVPLLVEHGNYFTNADKLALVSRPIFIGERTGWFLEISGELEEGGPTEKDEFKGVRGNVPQRRALSEVHAERLCSSTGPSSIPGSQPALLRPRPLRQDQDRPMIEVGLQLTLDFGLRQRQPNPGLMFKRKTLKAGKKAYLSFGFALFQFIHSLLYLILEATRSLLLLF